MFVSFCLSYAGIPNSKEKGFPQEAGCAKWAALLTEMGIYEDDLNDYTPARGDVVFFYVDQEINHVGIVGRVDTENNMLYTIEGNADGAVCKLSYALNDARIAGYGSMKAAMVRAGVPETEAQTTEAETEAQTTEAETEAQTTEAVTEEQTEAQTTEEESGSNATTGPRRQARSVAQNADEEAKNVTITAQLIVSGGSDEETAQMVGDLSTRKYSSSWPPIRYGLYRSVAQGVWTGLESQYVTVNSSTETVAWENMPVKDEEGHIYTYAVMSAYNLPDGYASDTVSLDGISGRFLQKNGNGVFTETFTKASSSVMVTAKLVPGGSNAKEIYEEWKSKGITSNYALYRSTDGVTWTQYEKTQTARESNSWEVSWVTPKRDKNGYSYTYAVRRIGTAVSNPYASQYATQEDLPGENNVFTDIWTKPETVTVTAVISWSDEENQLGYRPKTAEELGKVMLSYGDPYQLMQAEVTANEDGTYTAVWENVLSTYNGTQVTEYTITEPELSKRYTYAVSTNGKEWLNYTVKNTLPMYRYSAYLCVKRYISEDIMASSGIALPKSVTATLYSGNQIADVSDAEHVFTVSTSSAGVKFWRSETQSYSWLYPVYDAAGNKLEAKDISVTWTSDFLTSKCFETSRGEYKYSDSATFNLNVDYPYTGISSITVKWDDNGDSAGLRPDNAILKIYAGDSWLESTGTTTLTTKDGRQYLDKSQYLPERDQNGDTQTYTLHVENLPPYYTAEPVVAKDEATVTLKLNSAYTQTATASVKWYNTDSENEDADRPSSVFLTLEYKTEDGDWQKFWGTSRYEVQKQAGDTWTYTWSNLPTVDAAGNTITYRVTQDSLEPRYGTNVLDPVVTKDANGNVTSTAFEIHNTYKDAWNYGVDLYWVTKASDPASEKYEISRVTTSSSYLEAQYALHIYTQKPYDVGKLRIRIRRELFDGRDGVAAGTVPCEISLGDSSNTTAAYYFTYKIDPGNDPDDTSDDVLEFYNYRKIEKEATNTTIHVTYRIAPAEVTDCAVGKLQATGYGTHTDQTKEEKLTTQEISYRLDTGVKISYVTKGKKTTYYGTPDTAAAAMYTWDTSKFGPQPTDFDPTTYNYVWYIISTNCTGNQPGKLVFTEKPQNGGEVYRVWAGTYLNASASTPIDFKKNNDGSYTWEETMYGSGDRYERYVIVRYERPTDTALPEGQTTFEADYTNEVTARVVATDVHDDDKKEGVDFNDEDDADASYTFHWKDYVYQYSGDIYAGSKSLELKSDSPASGGVYLLKEKKDIHMTYTVTAQVFGYDLKYGYRMELGDDTMYACATIGDETTEYVPLTAADYELTGTPTVRVNSQHTDEKTGATGVGIIPEEPFILYGRKSAAEQWEKIGEAYMTRSLAGTIAYTGDTLTFSSVDGKGYTALKLESPEGLDQCFSMYMSCPLTLKGNSTVVQNWFSEAEAKKEEISQIHVENLMYFKLFVKDENGKESWFNPWETTSNTLSRTVGQDAKDFETDGSYRFRKNRGVSLGNVSYGTYIAKTVSQTEISPSAMTVSVKFAAAATEIMYGGTVLPTEEKESFSANSGIFYDLLPEGYRYDSSREVSVSGTSGYDSNALWSNGLSASLVGVETKDNYNGSGRQLVIFRIQTDRGTGQNYFQYTNYGYVYTGFKVVFWAIAGYDDITSGATQYNTVAYQRGDEKAIHGGYTDRGYGNESSTTYYPLQSNGVTRVLYDLDGDENTEGKTDTLYAYKAVSVSFTQTITNNLAKMVKANSGLYKSEDVTDRSGTYTYKIRLQTQKGGKTKDVVIFDRLEDAVNTEAGASDQTGWNGSFVSVDTSSAEKKGINVVVYYCTDSSFTYNDYEGQGKDINAVLPEKNGTLWSTTPPANLSDVKALAFDLRKKTDGSEYEFAAEETVELIIHMKAPENLKYTADTNELIEYAYNRPAYYSTLVGNSTTTSFNIGNTVKVSLHDLQEFTFYKLGETDDGATPLAGVGFSLYKTQCTNTSEDHDHGQPGVSGSCWESAAVQVAYSATDGKVSFTGLDSGEYAIVETSTKDGYEKLTNRWWTFTVDAVAAKVNAPVAHSSNEASYPAVAMKTQTGDTGTSYYTLENPRQKTGIYVSKTTNDDTNHIIRPEKLKFQIYRNKELYKTVAIDYPAYSSIVLLTDDLPFKDGQGNYYAYEVHEIVPDGYVEDYSSSQESGVRSVPAGTGNGVVYFQNTRQGVLEVTKSVSGKDNAEDSFTFTVALTDSSGNALAATDAEGKAVSITGWLYSSSTATNYETQPLTLTAGTDGTTTLSFSLKDGQRMVLLGLPLGTKYKVTETAQDHYTSKVTSGSAQGTLSNYYTTGKVTFTNTYVPDPIEVTLPVEKKITTTDSSKTSKNGFTFRLKPDSNTAGIDQDDMPMPSGTKNADGSATLTVYKAEAKSFPAISFGKAGTYVYSLEEDNSQEPGYSYDREPRTVTVTVTDTNGTLSASWSVTVNGKETAKGSTDSSVTDQNIVFSNSYSVGELNVELPVKKTITGSSRSESEKKKFTFTIEKAENTPADTPLPTNTKIEITDAGQASFPAITFKKAGVYSYLITETGSWAGYTNDTNNPKTVTVTVKERPTDDGKVELYDTWTVDDKAATIVEFTNSYQPTAATLKLSVKKEITGLARPEKKTFQFTIAPEDASAPNITNKTVTIEDEGTATFDALTFTETGTWYYKVSEVSDQHEYPGYTFDRSEYRVRVDVTAKDGVLTATPSYTVDGVHKNNITFTNEYNPTAAETSFKVTKKIDGSSRPEKQTFRFTLSAVSAGAPMPNAASVEIKDEGEASFNSISFSGTGVYVYKVAEMNSGAAGYTYADPIYAFVTVADPGTGKLTADVEYYSKYTATTSGEGEAAVTTYAGSGEALTDGLTFTNKYEPTAVSFSIPVEKQFSSTLNRPDEHTFTFALEGKTADTPMPADARKLESGLKVAETSITTPAGMARTDAGLSTPWTSAFTITYDKAGVYTYTLTEESGQATGGYSYDRPARSLVVTVTDTDGVLAASCTSNGTAVLPKTDTDSGTPIVFTNTYNPEEIDLTINVEKDVDGNTAPEAKTFSFLLEFDQDASTATDTLPMPEGTAAGSTKAQLDVTVAKDTSERTESFGKIVFKHPGTFVYHISEVIPAEATQANNYTVDGYTYDTTARTIRVEVKEKEIEQDGETKTVLARDWYVDDKLVGSGEYTGTAVKFTNRYTPTPDPITIPVKKTIEGNARPTGGEKGFTFTLTAVSDTAGLGAAAMPMPTGTEAGGTATLTITGEDTQSFDPITFERAGTYTYTLKETDGKAAGYTYDDTEHTIIATVTDNGGNLSASWTDNGKTVDAVEFTNKYKPKADSLFITVQKSIRGQERPYSQKKTFTFTLEAKTQNAPLPEEPSLTITDEGNKQFGAITYDTAGEYKYLLKESIPTGATENADGTYSLDGYTYAKDPVEITVTVTDMGGALSVSASSPGEVTISTTSQNDPVEDKPPGMAEQWKIVRNTIAVNVTNTYEPTPAELTLKASKQFSTAQERPTEATFRFTLTAENGAPMPETATGTSQVVSITTPSGTAKEDAGWENTFGTLKFKEEGEYKYVLEETLPASPGGYSADKKTRVLLVTAKNHSGKIVLSATLDGVAVALGESLTVPFTNTYDPTDLKVKIAVKKELTGETPPAAKVFWYTITAKTVGAPMPAAGGQRISTAGAGEASFGEIEFTEAGEYTYTIKEEIPKDTQGYSYDINSETKEHTVTIRVTDENSILKKTVTVDGLAQQDNDPLVTITNRYEPTTVSLTLPVSKIVTGNAPSDATFGFVLAAVADAPMPSEDGRTASVSTKDGAGTASFGAITFTHAGTYEYTIKEKLPEGADAGNGYKLNGYTYDAAARAIKVQVADTDGVLSIKGVTSDSVELAVTSDGQEAQAGAVAFTNAYAPKTTDYAIPVKKIVSGNVRPASELLTFSFKLTAVSTTAKGLDKGTMPMPVGDTVSKTDDGTEKFDGRVSFGKITFDRAGIYTYQVEETIPATVPHGYEYTKEKKTVTITVTDTNGVLSVTSAVDAASRNVNVYPLEFTNTYKPDPATLTLQVKKSITDFAKRQAEAAKKGQTVKDTFTYRLRRVTAGAPMPGGSAEEVAEISITNEGTGEFTPITFTAAGTYEYALAESADGHIPGYSYDRATRNIKAVVTDTDGKLSVQWTLNGEEQTIGADGVGEAIDITNAWTPGRISVTLPVQKVIDSANDRPEDQKQSFIFKLAAVKAQDTDGNAITCPMPEETAGAIVSITDAGRDDFGAITFKQPGTYTYTVTEDVPDPLPAGYTYDATPEKTIVVTVTEKQTGKTTGDVGTAELSATWTVDGKESERITFTNKYTPTAAKLALPVTKVIEGNARPEGEERTFSFNIKPKFADSGAPTPEKDTITITDTGNASFDAITFTKAGTYVYTVNETSAQSDYYTYDQSVYTVTVKVEDKGGELTAKASYTVDNETKQGLVFTNRYKPQSAPLTFTVEKKVAGNPRPQDGRPTFRFVLSGVATTAASGNIPLPDATRVSIADDGTKDFAKTASFEEITFTETGYYVYKIAEVQDTAGTGWSYTKDPLYAIVHVTDTNGKLSTETTYAKGYGKGEDSYFATGTAVTALSFTNTYTPQSDTLTIPVTKTIKNTEPSTPLTAETFTFRLTAQKNDAGLADTQMPLPGLPDGSEKKTADLTLTSDPSKSVTENFAAMTFTAAGVYEYSLEEVSGQAAGYSYETKVRTLTVKVTDNGGKLKCVWTLDNESVTAAAFTNTYDPSDLEVYLPVRKLISGNSRPEGGEKTFTFTLTAGTNTAGEGVDTPMPDSKVVTINDQGEASFGPISFTETGTYEYLVTETDGQEKGYTYVKEPKKVTVEVTDVGAALTKTWYVDGEKINDSESNDTLACIRFENTYAPAEAKTTIGVEKAVTGNARPQSLQQRFTFTLTAGSNTAGTGVTTPLPLGTEEGAGAVALTITDTGEAGFDKTAAFGEISFTKAGTYHYTLQETKNAGAAGFSWDETVRNITVTVTDTGGELSASWTVDGEPGVTVDGEAGRFVKFTNGYAPAHAYAQFTVEKKITGNARPDGQEKTFTFTLTAGSNTAGVETPMPENGAVLTINGTGDKSFGAIRYTVAGDYTYTLSETNTGQPGYRYAPDKTVTVRVTDEGGKLAAKWTEGEASDDEWAQAALVFTNDYTPKTTQLTLNVKKTFATAKSRPSKQVFTFLLTADGNSLGGEEANPLPSGAENGVASLTLTAPAGTSTDAGTAAFGAIIFTKAGTYRYTLREKTDSAASGYSFDDTVYELVVTVTDTAGELSLSYTVDEKAAPADDTLEFINTYTPPYNPPTPPSEEEPETSSETETETTSETETETASETETETSSETESETETETETESETESETGTEPITEPETEPPTESETQSETGTESETESQTGTESETETKPPVTEPETESETETESGSESESESESETETASETESETGTEKKKESETQPSTKPSTPSTPSTPSSAAKTGDETPLALWLMLMAVSAGGMSAAAVKKRRRKKKE